MADDTLTRRFAAPFHRRGEHGFTLFEVVITIGLLSIVSSSVLLIVVPVGRQSRLNREMEVAAASARNLIERIQVTPFNELLTVYPEGTVVYIPEIEAGSLTVSYEDATANPLVVQIVLNWTSPDIGPVSSSFLTVRTE